MFCQNRSILPSVIGWCGCERMCRTLSFASSCSNRVEPRHEVYCRPLSVSISRGTPNSPTPRRYVSSTCSAVWLRNTPSETMNRE